MFCPSGILILPMLTISLYTRAMQIGTRDILCLFSLCIWISMSVFLFEYSREILSTFFLCKYSIMFFIYFYLAVLLIHHNISISLQFCK